ncbi:GTPase Era [Leptolyngbya sp. FACHB-321]|uniref:GTPase Era n=1 Tax=Leptolyngbya sp. FACHB-321 TaxID=2692807 RepID=UPI001685AE9A|nr:GTPase Era [Leptolyngbya sp. FACHB-321]MBD2038404.1 GTPase Era [Leptolyngbya sp. FACHB-321]
MSELNDHDQAGFGLIPASPPGFRSGFVGIIGRPNVGKSTLMNYLVGQKIAITSPVAQTTRNRLRGILTTPTAQLIFVDTPGIHKPHHQLGKVLVKNAQVAIQSVDVLLFVVDGSVEAGGGDRFIANLLTHCQIPIILGINKADQQPGQDAVEAQESEGTGDADAGKQQSDVESKASNTKNADKTGLTPHPTAIRKQATPLSPHSFDRSYQELAASQQWNIAKFSALTGEGLEALQQQLIQHLQPGPYYYPPDLVTDQPERFIMGELIREQVLLLTREEVPHSTAIGIDRVEEEPTITRILATIYIERSSQKGILIGKGGEMLKAIGSASRQQIQKLVAGKVYLELFVKVQPKWRQSSARLAELGYRVEP